MKIVDTDAFLEMPQSSQLLYFHLAMRADDDGFIPNPKRIMRMIGSADDDYRVLLSKKFILSFESGVCVVKHWLIHNLIRSDRYTETQYVKEKQMLVVDNKTKKYSLDTGDNNDVIPDGNQMEPQVRLGKVRKGKSKSSKDTTHSLSFLRKLPDDVCEKLSEKYKISPKGIQEKATDLLLYCEQKGKKYKNYKSFLEKAVRKDKKQLQDEFTYVEPKNPVTEQIELSEEQIKRNEELKKMIRDGLNKKMA